MRIDKIIKEGSNLKLLLDDGQVLRITPNTLAKFLLYQGKDIDADLLSNIENQDRFSQLISSCIDLISRRPRTTQEIYMYLHRNNKGQLSEELIQDVINYLTEKAYLDDESFCKWWIDNRLNFRPKSSLELLKELNEHGIENSMAKTALSKYYSQDEEREAILSIVHKKYALESFHGLDRIKKQKIISYLARKGYNYELIKSVLEP